MGAVSVDQRAPIGPLPAGAKLGRYEILAKLAAGGMAIVYVARAHGVAGFERLVAIKVLHSNLAHEEEFIKMFLDEARLAASIRHPNVVPTIDISDSEKSGYFIVMEYIEGDHLGQLLSSANKAGEKLPIPVTLRIIGDALGGLGAAHDLVDENGRPQNLVHRDVSPHNIMVGRDGVARLTDFGVAKAEDRLTHTRDGQVKGKLAYMAPEQAASGTTDTRSDLFSMGVILWECVTGQRLLRAESTAATLHKLLHAEFPRPSSVDAALAPLDAVLEKALARDSALRYQTAEEFSRAVEDVASSFGGAASLREVGRACKHHAAIKLKRDKKLIDEALRALRPAGPSVESEGMVAADEMSSPTSPSSSDISIVAGASPSVISKVGNVLANDTMPGTRRAGRRTPELALPPRKVQPPPTPPGVAERAATARAEVARAANAETARIAAASALLIDVDSAAMPSNESRYDTLELSPPLVHSRRMLGLAFAVIGGVLLGAIGIWVASSSQEVVRVEQMETQALGHETPSLRAIAPPATSEPIEPATPAAAVVPVATVPASQHEGLRRGPVNRVPPAAQVFAPVVPSAAASAASATPSTRSRDAARSARAAARRSRESSVPRARGVINAARPTDVIPNPYHD